MLFRSVGGGFIGLEMAENLAERGAKVTIVEKMEQLLSPLDADMAAFVHAKFRAVGVSLRLGCAVTGFEEKDGQVVTNVDVGPAIAAETVSYTHLGSPKPHEVSAHSLSTLSESDCSCRKHLPSFDGKYSLFFLLCIVFKVRSPPSQAPFRGFPRGARFKRRMLLYQLSPRLSTPFFLPPQTTISSPP